MGAHFVLDARTATPHFPGIGRYVRSLAAALIPQLRSDERLTLLTSPAARLHLAGASSLDVAASPFSLAQQIQVPRILRTLRPSVYHSPYYLMPYSPGAPTVVTVYDIIPLREPRFSTARARLLFRLTTRLALRTAQHAITITEHARQDFIRTFGVSPGRMTAIPLAADPSFGPQPQEALSAVHRKYGLPERFVLYLGSNKPHKNLVGLVAAWGRMPRVGPELVIAGAWDERYPEARQLAEAQGGMAIHWIGPVPDDDLPALYSAAEVFVFPSLFEGFGLPVIEAMACGAPVICSDVTALPEVAGSAALLVPPNSHTGWALALEGLLSDGERRAELREKGFARAAQFSWERTAAQTLDVYREVMA